MGGDYPWSNYDVLAWKLFKRPKLITNKEEMIEELDRQLVNRDNQKIGEFNNLNPENTLLLLERQRTKLLKETIVELKKA